MASPRIASFGLLPAILLAALSSSGALAGSSPIPGFFDLSNGTFTALAHSPAELQASMSASAPAAPAPKLISGTLLVRAVLTVEASIPASATFSAYAYTSAGSTYATSPFAAVRSGTAQSTGTVQRSGSTATATVTIPYRMTIDGTATTMSISMSVNTSATAKPYLQVSKIIPIPANGATTPVTLQGAL